jgi:hypothetical protein
MADQDVDTKQVAAARCSQRERKKAEKPHIEVNCLTAKSRAYSATNCNQIGLQANKNMRKQL